MSRGVYRGIHSSLLDDPDFQRLSPSARHVLLTVRLCKDAGPAVIFRYYLEVIARQTGFSTIKVQAALNELEAQRWIVLDHSVLWVSNGLRHDPMIKLSSAKHTHAVVRQIEALPSSSYDLIVKFCEYYKIGKAIDSLSRPEQRCPPIPNTDTEVLPDTEQGVTDSPPRVGNGRVAPVITTALDRSARLGAVPRLRSPAFWYAEAGAAGG